jgi:hypothetical protein
MRDKITGGAFDFAIVVQRLLGGGKAVLDT